MTPKSSQTTSLPAPAIASSTSTPAEILVATPEPTFTLVPPVTEPVFSNVRFGTSPDDASNTTSFPAGTKAVYAIWDYQNMRDGLMVKREWYWNGQPWIVREEPWDFQKYGANGTIRDISIYDNQTGLNSGVYQLRLYIDGYLQPVGPELDAPVKPWITFYIGSDEEKHAEYMSPDFLSAVEVLDGKHIILQGVNESSREIYTGREIPYVAWFEDGTHFVFVDRDRSAQKPGLNLGIRDDLWLVDLSNSTTQLLYKSDTLFTGPSGPVVSPGGRYIVSLEGSGFGDACLVDTHLIFFELAGDSKSIRVIKQDEFSGLPDKRDGSVYPVGQGFWQDENNLEVTLDGTCNVDRSQLGDYFFDMAKRTARRTVSPGLLTPSNPGWARLYGKVTDLATGMPISGATVSCEHHSRFTQATCSGTKTTNTDGMYAFENLFFHPTDTLILTVKAPGYQSQQISPAAYTMKELEVNISLATLP